MKVVRYCRCAVKLDREVADEDAAREVVAHFWREHSGTGHGIINFKEYRRIISSIIQTGANRRVNSRPELFNIEANNIREISTEPTQVKSLGRAVGEILEID